MEGKLSVRAETSADFAAVRDVHGAAFGQPQEARLVEALRGADAISLVAVSGGRVVGHILFSHVALGSGRILALAPMSVLPAFQGKGIGSALVRAGLAEAEARGEPAVIVLGHEWFYPKFGFVPARPLGIEAPFPVPDHAWMIRAWRPVAPGRVTYPPAFDEV